MNEYSPLLNPSPDAPAFVVHNVQHDATAQMGQCCMGDGVRTNTLCEICDKYICRSHFRTHYSNDRMVTGDRPSPFCWLTDTYMRQHHAGRVCPNCEMDEPPPAGSSKTYVNTKGKVMAVLGCVIVLVGSIAVLAN